MSRHHTVSRESEAMVLGALMADPRCVDDVADLVTANDFADPVLRRAFASAMALASDERAATMLFPETVAAHMHAQGVAEAQAETDRAMLAEIFERVATAQNVVQHARLVRNHSMLRRLSDVAQQIREAATGAHPEQADEVVEHAQDVLLTAFERETCSGAMTAKQVAKLHGDAMKRRMEPGNKERRVGFGIRSLDKMLPGGLRRGAVYLIGAGTGGGKTALLCHVVRQSVAGSDEGVVHASLEVPNVDIWERHMAAMMGVDADRLLTGMLSDLEIGRYVRASQQLGSETGDRLVMLDETRLTVPRLEREVRRRNRRSATRVGYVAVDYAQLVRPVGKHRVREEAVREIADDLLALAKTYGLTVLAAVQFNRNQGARADKGPQLSDIRESDGLAFNSTGVVLMHAPDGDDSERRDLCLRKNRGGPTGVASCRYDRAKHTFSDFDAPEGFR